MFFFFLIKLFDVFIKLINVICLRAQARTSNQALLNKIFLEEMKVEVFCSNQAASLLLRSTEVIKDFGSLHHTLWLCILGRKKVCNWTLKEKKTLGH